jgi:hypothetical protein
MRGARRQSCRAQRGLSLSAGALALAPYLELAHGQADERRREPEHETEDEEDRRHEHVERDEERDRQRQVREIGAAVVAQPVDAG